MVNVTILNHTLTKKLNRKAIKFKVAIEFLFELNYKLINK